MNYSFEYIDIILLAMIAGFIFLRLRGILGKKTGYEEDISTSFPHEYPTKVKETKLKQENFGENEKKEFLKGANIAYETIIINFAKGNISNIKYLLDKAVYEQFNDAVKERNNKGHISETTFIGINSSTIKDHKQNNNILEVTVDFVSEIISTIKDKEKKIISGNPDKIKKVYDTWKFSRDTGSKNPNWLLIDTQVQLINKISDKDKKDWENFIKKNDKLYNKDKDNFEKSAEYEKTLDLHGYTLSDANNAVKDLVINSYNMGIKKLNIITGKGMHSDNSKDPYKSEKFGILKYSVPEFIQNNDEIVEKINNIDFKDINNLNCGKFSIYLKTKK